MDDASIVQLVEGFGEWLLTETEELLSIALGTQTQAEEAAVREPLDQAAALLRPKPASKASVEALEKLVFDGEVDYQCVVCMEEMVRGDQVTCLPCSHVFHGNCVIKWLKLSHTCPVCRFKLPTECH
ncbi:hypothetical protein GBA52_015818 [Prunus armeniaca]|nr:hypothetical protein GBA52_015818 [Prunus armeniaca]